MADPTSSTLRLALIGMSGTGKTFWSKRLAETGRPVFCCDDRSGQGLGGGLGGGFAGTFGVVYWMGWRDSPTYAQREAEYLAEEIAALDEVLTDLVRNPARQLILDTTGSVIYTGNNLLLRLRRQMTVVYLAASPAEQQLLIERYLTDPKPVLCRGAVRPFSAETRRATARVSDP